MSDEKDKPVSFSSFTGDQKKSALAFGGGAGYLLYEGAGYGILQIAEMFGYEGEIKPLDSDQQKALAEASARALAYLLGEMVSNPLLACVFLLGTILKDNTTLRKKPEAIEGNAEKEEETQAAKKALKCCKNWEWRPEDRATAGYGPGEGHHPACRHFKGAT